MCILQISHPLGAISLFQILSLLQQKLREKGQPFGFSATLSDPWNSNAANRMKMHIYTMFSFICEQFSIA